MDLQRDSQLAWCGVHAAQLQLSRVLLLPTGCVSQHQLEAVIVVGGAVVAIVVATASCSAVCSLSCGVLSRLWTHNNHQCCAHLPEVLAWIVITASGFWSVYA